VSARRRKSKESPAELLFKAPWWVSIAIGVVVFVFLKWIAPAAWGSSPTLKPITTLMSGLAWLFSGIFLFVGALSFARQKVAASRSPSSKAAAWNPRVIDGGRSEAKPGFPEVDQPVPSQWSSAPAVSSPPTEWSLKLLQDLEWKRFEDVCQKFYETKGIKSETTPLGPDGGIDIRLYQDDTGKASAIVQCKAWGEKDVGVKPVRELLGVMAHEKITKAFFMAAGGFTDDAKTFAAGNKITLVTGDMLVAMIRRLPDADKQALLAFATAGDYHTPTCPSCGIKMRHVSGTGGRSDFWGCVSYPRCKQKLGMRAADRQ
jgi:restriction system protein